MRHFTFSFCTKSLRSGQYFTLKYISGHTSHISNPPRPHVAGGCLTEQNSTARPVTQSTGLAWELVRNAEFSVPLPRPTDSESAF